MSNTSDSQDPSTPTPKAGGFGAFADKYRERWAADHPKAANHDGARATPLASTAPAPEMPTAPEAPDAVDDAPGPGSSA